MERIDRIVSHPVFQKTLREINLAEAERIFCRHGMEHLLDVARIAWIINLEEGAALERDMVYAAAFLHDIGKARQYRDGTPHQFGGCSIAVKILNDCGFLQQEADEIVDAISHHRDRGVRDEKNLRGIIYRADKASRACYGCVACEACDWPDEKKNLKVVY